MNTSKMFATLSAASGLALSLATAQAQVVSTPFGNLPAGARPVSLSPSAPYNTNPYNRNTQDYSVFGGANGGAAFPNGYVDYSGIGYGVGFDALGSGFAPGGGLGYFGAPLNSAFGSGSLVVLNSPYTGGYSNNGQNGSPLNGAGNDLGPYQNMDMGDMNAPEAGMLDPNDSAANADGLAVAPRPQSLTQQITVKRGRNFDLTFAWRGDPDLIESLTVTLLNRYRLPIAQQMADSGRVYFPVSQRASAARFYRVDVTYADGAVASLTAAIR